MRHIREYGEIGKHKGFKIPRLIAYEFESRYSHQISALIYYV